MADKDNTQHEGKDDKGHEEKFVCYVEENFQGRPIKVPIDGMGNIPDGAKSIANNSGSKWFAFEDSEYTGAKYEISPTSYSSPSSWGGTEKIKSAKPKV